MSAPIPEPRSDDDEDVGWALSTAASLWSRGDAVEALKWLRRAAESASDVGKDERSLELAKAAADVAANMQESRGAAPSQTPPPPPVALREGAGRAPPPLPQRTSAPPQQRSAPPPPRNPSVAPVEPAASTVPAPRVGDRMVGRPSAPPPAGRSSMPPPMPQRVSAPPAPPNVGVGGAARGTAPSSPQALASAARASGASGVSGAATSAASAPAKNAKTLASETRLEDAERALAAGAARKPTTPVVVRESPPSTKQPRERTRTGAGGRRGTRQPRDARASRPEGAPPSTRSVPDAAPTIPGSAAMRELAAASARATVVVPPKRMHEEVTVERDFLSALGPAAAAGLDDLDEQTNVISTRGERSAAIASAAQAVRDGAPAESETEPHGQVGVRDVPSLRAHRVALALDPDRGGIQVLPLAADEPAPPGLVAALIVPSDLAASGALADMFDAAARARVVLSKGSSPKTTTKR